MLHRYTFALLAFLDGLIFVISAALVTHIVIKVLEAALHWYGERISREKDGEVLAREMLPLVDKVGKVVLFAVGLMIVLDPMVVTDALNSAITAKFKSAGIDIPFPTRTIHLHNEAKSDSRP